MYIEWSRFGDDDVVSYLVPLAENSLVSGHCSYQVWSGCYLSASFSRRCCYVDSLDSGQLDIVVISSGQVLSFC